MAREAIYAGSFYPRAKTELESFMANALDAAKEEPAEAKDAKAYVAPHAGYIYSGRTAAYAYKAIIGSAAAQKADTSIIIGPNHTGIGMPIAVSMQDWKTPLGIVKNDLELSHAIVEESAGISEDEAAHADEHSVEVQLPFLQRALPGKRACMICMGDQRIGAAIELAGAIARAAARLRRKVLVIASSDFNHYEAADIAKRKDEKLLAALSKIDENAFYSAISETGDTACGFGPITVAMLFAKQNGAKKGLLLNYSNSGETTKDYSSVVAYASLAFV